MVTVEPSKTLTLLWGATGEQEWTPALTTGKKAIQSSFKEINEGKTLVSVNAQN